MSTYVTSPGANNLATVFTAADRLVFNSAARAQDYTVVQTAAVFNPNGSIATPAAVTITETANTANVITLPSDFANTASIAGRLLFARVNGAADSNLLLGSNDGEQILTTAQDAPTAASVIYGFGGNDNIFANTGPDTVYGGDGNDLISGDDALGIFYVFETFQLTDGNDLLLGEGGNDTIYGNGGDDTIYGGAGADSIRGGDGNDTLAGATLNLGDPTDLADTIDGGNGTDIVQGNNGADSLAGGAGADTLQGGSDNDTIYGETFLNSTSASDTTTAGAGADSIVGGLGGDTIYAGGGDDVISGGNSSTVADTADGNDLIYGQAGNDTIQGNAGNDTIDGGVGNDNIGGGQGADSLLGGDGDDVIRGGAGADSIIGGVGTDTLSGGVDTDTFYFSAGDTNYTPGVSGGNPTGFDVITDFNTVSEDIIITGFTGGLGQTVLTATGVTFQTLAAALTFAEQVFDNGGNNDIVALQVGGTDTYLFYNSGFSGLPSDIDSIIQLQGVTSAVTVANFQAPVLIG